MKGAVRFEVRWGIVLWETVFGAETRAFTPKDVCGRYDGDSV
ncbi:MAG: hypothetical protein NTU85_00080 [Candidatus Kaiserbacteria bacterium]|nr:hypothetical protein [Candidatus Kaiserbacteria bacterium]